MTVAERLAIELGAPLGEVDGRKLAPMLCSRDESGERVLSDRGWLFELKLDGVRILADKRAGRVSLSYRKLRSATASYPEIADALAKLGEDRLVLDGEIVAFDSEGRPDFQRLGTRIQRHGADARRAALRVPVVYVVFDVLAIGPRVLTGLPLEARKAILEQVLGGASRANGLVRMHPTFPDGEGLFRLCREQGLEGVVAKRLGSAYRPDERSPQWVKIKCELDADLVVVGWTEGEGGRSRLGALDLAAYDGGRLVVRGRVGSGLDEATIDDLYERLRALEVPRSMADDKPRPKRGRHHVRPAIVVSVRYMGVSDEGLLRFPVFRGVRHDLAPEDCTLEAVAPPAPLAASTSFAAPAPASAALAASAPLASTSNAAPAPAGVAPRGRLTSPSTVVLADGTTKAALCSYYEAVAPALAPYLRGRVCPLLRAPAPTSRAPLAAPAHLWPLPSWTPSEVRTGMSLRGNEQVPGVLFDGVDTLRFLVEAGVTSLEMTSTREGTSGAADFLALTIEGEGASRVALRARELVAETGLTAFVKLSRSGVGLDVLVPVGEASVETAHMLGALLARLLGTLAESVASKIALLDAPLAPYGVVAPLRPGARATASVPLTWAEVEAGPQPPSLERVAAAVAGGAPDPMRAMLDLAVDFAYAVRAIEHVIAAGGWAGG